MVKNYFRKTCPMRTCTKVYSNYSSYKKFLAKDFNHRCGYTDSSDIWFGGMTTFHVDHFRPLKDYPGLKADYSNLVYSCSYVNILKSNDDPNKYLEPCLDDYNTHFFRNSSGQILPNLNSPKAKYMHEKLKLGLARYQVIWLLDNIFDRMKQLQNLAQNFADDSEDSVKINKLNFQLTAEFVKYFEYIRQT